MSGSHLGPLINQQSIKYRKQIIREYFSTSILERTLKEQKHYFAVVIVRFHKILTQV